MMICRPGGIGGGGDIFIQVAPPSSVPYSPSILKAQPRLPLRNENERIASRLSEETGWEGCAGVVRGTDSVDGLPFPAPEGRITTESARATGVLPDPGRTLIGSQDFPPDSVAYTTSFGELNSG